jgi:predicted Fe-Mo cluster-binding NifX family protein
MSLISIDGVLVEIARWYEESANHATKPSLLSKLALIELCSWVEHELDDRVRAVALSCICNSDWVEKNVIKDNYGFLYKKNFRAMLCKVIGESGVSAFEARFEDVYPGELERLESLLAALSKKRNEHAHNSFPAQIARQMTFDAPSWTIAQHQSLQKLLSTWDSVPVEEESAN